MTLEGIVERVIGSIGKDDLARARLEFHALTGAFEATEPFYEERIRAFFDWLAVERDHGALLARVLERAVDLSPEDRAIGTAFRVSMRSLWRVTERERDGDPVLECMLHGARFAVQRDEGPAARLRHGDVLDGRLVGASAVLLAPGPVFHPRESHEALARLLTDARSAARCDARLLDPLLRMRMRFDRFTSIHAKHVYRFDAIDRTEILAAPWAGGLARGS